MLILSVYELAVFLLLRMLGREVVSLRFGVPEDGGNIRRTTWLGTPVYFAAPYHPVSTLFIQRIGPNRSLHIRSSCVAHLAKIVFNIPLAMELDYKRAAEIQMHPRANVSVAHNLLVTASAFFWSFRQSFSRPSRWDSRGSTPLLGCRP